MAIVTKQNKPIGILTCRGFEEFKQQDRGLIEALRQKGYPAESVVWDESPQDWARYQTVIISSVWDYCTSTEKFLQFIDTVLEIDDATRLANLFECITFNSSKRYLKILGRLGFNTIETIWLSKEKLQQLPSRLESKNWTKIVIKPVVSAGGRDTMVFHAHQVNEFVNKCEGLKVSQWMVQPFANEIIEEGEYSFIFLSRKFSHCVLKKPNEGCFLTGANHTSRNVAVTPSERMLAEAQKVVDYFTPCIAMRVDGIKRGDEFLLMEAEMIEPYLYPDLSPGFSDRHADAVIEWLGPK